MIFPYPDAWIAGPASPWMALPGLDGMAPRLHFGGFDWAAWCVVVLAVAWVAGGLRRWAGSYARRVAAGAEADGLTLRQALRGIRRQAYCPWRDGLPSLLLAAAAGVLLLHLSWAAGLALSGLCLGLAALAWLDARSGLLPDALTLPVMVLGWVCGPLPLLVASSASALLWAALSSLAVLYRWVRGAEGFGAGDVKYLAALAGWLGILPAVTVLWGACVLGLLMWTWRGGGARQGYRFGPCMTLVALPVILAMPVVQSGF